MLGWFISHSLEPNRTQRKEHSYVQEDEQYKEMGINLKKSANMEKAVITDVVTPWGTTKLIRWTNKHEKIVLFVHGILTDKFTSSKAVALWNKKGYDVVSYDGYGWGDWRESTRTRYGSNTESKLLNLMVKHVKKLYKLDKIVLQGESMGGATVYRYIQHFGTSDLDRVLVDAGYLSFEKNLRAHAFKKVPKPLYYLGRLSLWFWLWTKRMPIRRQISAKTLANIKVPLVHIHSIDDTMVSHSTIKKEIHKFVNNAHYEEYKKKTVRHVRGYYDAPVELNGFVTKLLGYKTK